jgi:hypothetical protein
MVCFVLMSHVLREIPLMFQQLPLTGGSSVRHAGDMPKRRSLPLSPIDICVILACAYRLDPKDREPFLHRLKRGYERRIRAQALGLRRYWRTADVPRLLRYPGWASPASQSRMARLLKVKLVGRGVIPEPLNFDQAVVAAIDLGFQLVNPRVSPSERLEAHKRMPTFPVLVEAAYRGELRRSKPSDPSEPHLKASEQAQSKVAEAADISSALVHKICDRVRKDLKERKRPLEPEMTAKELRAHLTHL